MKPNAINSRIFNIPNREPIHPRARVDLNVVRDLYTPGGSAVDGMPDPSKYPDWFKNRTTTSSNSEWKYVPDYNKYPRDEPGICGGWDAPMFHNGQVMSRREYHQRLEAGQI